MQKIHVIVLFLLFSLPAFAQARDTQKPPGQISVLSKHDTPKYDRKAHNRYNTKESKQRLKYDDSKRNAYNKKQSKKKVKYVKSKHNTYNEKDNKQFSKHTKKHTKMYYSKYSKYAR